MIPYLINWLHDLGLGRDIATAIAIATGVFSVAFLAYLANVVAKRLVLRLVQYFVSRTETKWDDTFVQRGTFVRLSQLAPALVIYLLTPLLFAAWPSAVEAVSRLVHIYMLLVGLMVIDAALNAANDIYRTFESSKQIPLKGLIQVIKVVLYGICGIVVLAIILDKTPLYLLSGLGAITAVLLIVFKDPILGLVAGIQLSANKMIAIGDWVEMPSHKADGDVIDVALTTIKIRNWDKTITTIPTYDMISRPFKNWQGMRETGGRRIKRSINLDMSTIRLCDEEMLRRFARIQHIQEYLDHKQEELAQYNAQNGVSDESLANGRRLTNIGTYRAYVVAYLKNHPRLRQDLTFLVRQLAPTKEGLPIQIYVFVDDVRWAMYEDIQADIFDHLMAVVPQFDLRIFQDPTGLDVRAGLLPQK